MQIICGGIIDGDFEDKGQGALKSEERIDGQDEDRAANCGLAGESPRNLVRGLTPWSSSRLTQVTKEFECSSEAWCSIQL